MSDGRYDAQNILIAMVCLFACLAAGLWIGYASGKAAAETIQCEGYVVGSPFGWECYPEDLVGVCIMNDTLYQGQGIDVGGLIPTPV